MFHSIITKLCSMKARVSLQHPYKREPFHSALIIQLVYFVSLSCTGFMALKVAKPKHGLLNDPNNLDLLFMSASASTVSSMGTIEMEDFSDSQLWVLTILMLVGGEVFTSMLGLQSMKAKNKRKEVIPETRAPISNELECPISELNSVGDILPIDEEFMKSNAIRSLSTIVLSYLATVITMGSVLVLLYIRLVPSAKEVLKRKHIKLATFSVFMTISSFTNCGFLPTNENMIPFKEDSFLQLLVVIIVLAGNTLFPSCLRLLIWVLNKLTKGTVYSYMLHNPGSIGYQHLFTREDSIYLFSTVFVFIVVQIAAFCSLEWNSEALQKLNPFQKLIGALFQSVNTRHAGESIIDMSTVAPAVLVLYIVMMYLPPYTRFLPSKEVDNDTKGKGRSSFTRDAIISKLSILAVFVIIICITERKAMVEDPLNFNVLNIVFEVISAYGNVGFSIGYSCKRLLNPDSSCKDAWYGFVGRWSRQGKLTLMLVMFFGRLKTSIPEGGKFWKLR
ncbi:hypothetical protein HPP92_000249 [Vanilla planifolia]|uniref:Uncharacterized protein n=2 Tax=Vanilla planifolia TaxID=51239 RepID=A0A835SAV5_VANPL|nr:hypothetical protein HPP92_000249 [Vanilla planifolia]